jgi:hypothetical protein
MNCTIMLSGSELRQTENNDCEALRGRLLQRFMEGLKDLHGPMEWTEDWLKASSEPANSSAH